MEYTNPNTIFLFESNLDNFFPQVKDYIDGNIKKLKLLKSDQIIYKRKININPDFNIPIERQSDVVYCLELIGDCEEVYDYISSIEIYIGGSLICNVYLSECYVCDNDGKFLIKLDFDKIFLNYPFIPIVALQFHNFYFKINGVGLATLNINAYLTEGILTDDLRKNCIELRHDILFNHYEKYKLKISGKKIYLNCGYSTIGKCNFIKSLKFQFVNPVEFDTITIYGNKKPLTILTKSDIIFINNREFIIDKFYYKTFLFNQIVIEFNNFLGINHLTLITTNYNILNIHSGIGGVTFTGLKRDIFCNSLFDYIKIPEELFLEKVLPKDDKLCAISHEEFQFNDTHEERIICGKCFTSYKRHVIEEWFEQKREKICPYGRCNSGIWYIK